MNMCIGTVYLVIICYIYLCEHESADLTFFVCFSKFQPFLLHCIGSIHNYSPPQGAASFSREFVNLLPSTMINQQLRKYLVLLVALDGGGDSWVMK